MQARLPAVLVGTAVGVPAEWGAGRPSCQKASGCRGWVVMPGPSPLGSKVSTVHAPCNLLTLWQKRAHWLPTLWLRTTRTCSKDSGNRFWKVMATSSSEVTSPSPFMSYLAYLPSLVRDWLLGRGWLALVALEKGRPCCRHQRGTLQQSAVERGRLCCTQKL